MIRGIVAGLLLCLCSCSKVRTINGTLSLTGKDDRTVALPGIEVAAHDLEACAEAITAKVATRSLPRNEAANLYARVNQLVEHLSSQAKKAEAARKAAGADQARAEALQQEASARERRGIALLKSADLLIQWLRSAGPEFENLPGKLSESVKTDSAGRFALTIPKDKAVVVVAIAESAATGELQTYFWIAKVAPHEDYITLSSKNETAAKLSGSTGAGDSLLTWTQPLKASLADIKNCDVRPIEQEMEELSKESAKFPLQ